MKVKFYEKIIQYQKYKQFTNPGRMTSVDYSVFQFPFPARNTTRQHFPASLVSR